GYIARPGDPAWVWQASTWRMTKAQTKEWGVMAHNLSYGSRLAWHAAMTRAMLVKANWLANRLNLPIKRPIQESDVSPSLIGDAAFRVLRHYPSWIPDSVYGTNICDTNISRLQRILALKIGIGGTLDTPTFEFTFEDGQLAEIVRQNVSQGENYGDRFAEVMAAPHIHPPLARTDKVYQIATDYLAAIDINLDMLEKSRLPHPVRQEEYKPAGASDSVPVYFVAWGTNYYGLKYLYHYWHTNEWHPSVTVEIGPYNELLEIYVGDPTFFRNPPTCIPSQTNWRLVHTPDPPVDQLTNPAVMRELFLTPKEAAAWVRDARTPLWYYQHNKIKDLPISSADKAELIRGITNELDYFHSILIPYKPGDNPEYDTNQP
ncbi:MAG: hypothetical protein ACREE6_17620, partial [Limisphaerales bacterium]